MSQHETFHFTEENFPEVLREITLYVGHDAAMKLVKAFGGSDIYVPVLGHQLPKELVETIGQDAAVNLCKGLGGSKLYIPRLLKGLLLSRNISVCLEYEELIASMNSNAAINVLVRRYSLSNRYIYLILKGTDPAAVTTERKRRRVAERESATRAPAGSVPLKTL